MFKRLTIEIKILIAFLAIAIVAVGILGLVAFTLAKRTMEAESFNKLTAVREMKARQIEDYHSLINQQIITLSEDRMIINAMKAFDESLHTIRDEREITDEDQERMDADLRQYYEEEFLERLIPNLQEEATVSDYWPEDEDTRLLQSIFISENPYSTGSKHFLDNPGDGTSYSEAHETYHPLLRDYLERFGYYDIFLVDVDSGGHISYSVFKEVDFGTSLLDGPYSHTNFAEAFQAARNADNPNFVYMVDFESYAPSYNAPAAFIASPIFDGDKKIGVLVFQMPIDRINDIMTSGQSWAAVGLGDSGETYIVGDDYLLRNQSRFLIEDSENYFTMIEEIGVPQAIRDQIRNFNSTIGLQEVRTEGTEAALSGESGTRIFPDYRGVPVLSSYKPLDILDMNWVIMSEIDESEAFAAVRSLTWSLLLVLGGLVVAIVIAGIVFSRSITRPIGQLSAHAEALAAGNLEVEVDTSRNDEIGDLARSFDAMRISLKHSIQELQDINQHLEQRVADRTAELEESELRSRSIVDAAADAIIVLNSEGKVTLWNQAAEHTFGFTKEEIVEKSIHAILPERFRNSHDRAFHQVNQAKRLNHPGVTHQLSGLHKDGHEFPVELTLSHYQVGDASFVSGILRDVSELRQMEQQIADQLAFTETLIDTIPNPMFATGRDQCFILFNRAYEQAYGVKRKDWIGKTIMDVDNLSFEERQRYRDENVALLESGGMNHSELDIPFADGELHTILQWVTTYNQSDGNIGGLLGITADITEQKRLEMEIANQLSFVQSLVDTIPNPLFVKGVDAKYITFNAAYEQAFAIKRDDYIGKTVLDMEFLPKKTRQAYQDEDSALLQTGGEINREIQLPFSDQRLHDIIYQVKTFDLPDGQRGGLMGLLTDISQLKELERQLAHANERMSIELNFAREIQLSMLPLIFPAFPTRTEVGVYARLQSAREVGGDFYDFYFLDDDHLAFVIADVSGKGAPGALLMAVSKTLIKSRASDDHEPASILTHVNNELSQNNESAMFITAFLGVLNVKTGVIQYTNAGHNPPYIKRRDGAVEKLDAFHGPVIGALPGMTYKHDRAVLGNKDMIVLYTDGVTEAMDESEALFSDERFEALLHNDTFISPTSVVDGTIASVLEHKGEAEQSDDITILVIQQKGRIEQTETHLQLRIKNQIEEVGMVEERFHEFSEQHEIPDEPRQQMSIVLDEMLNNVVNYAYEDSEEHEIQIDIELSGKRLVVTIKDDGIPFNPFGLESPDVTQSISERQIGGLGIHLVRSMMDEYQYQRQINKNVVTLVKLID